MNIIIGAIVNWIAAYIGRFWRDQEMIRKGATEQAALDSIAASNAKTAADAVALSKPDVPKTKKTLREGKF